MTTNKQQIGDPVDLPTRTNGIPGEQLTVTVEWYADEEPDCIEINGHACLVFFDPGTMTGRAQIRTLIGRLNQAMAFHTNRVEEIYGNLKDGDHCNNIRLPAKSEERCPRYMFTPCGQRGVQCSRAHHEDHHHVHVDDDYQVIAVLHATDRVLSQP
jgi:hypothetical protein